MTDNDNTKPGDLSGLADTELVASILHFNNEIVRYEHELARRRSEQEARALADWWRRHPEFVEVKVGQHVIKLQYGSKTLFDMYVTSIEMQGDYWIAVLANTNSEIGVPLHIISELVAHQSEGNR